MLLSIYVGILLATVLSWFIALGIVGARRRKAPDSQHSSLDYKFQSLPRKLMNVGDVMRRWQREAVILAPATLLTISLFLRGAAATSGGGAYWWDELAISGVLTAMEQGHSLLGDQWAPFVLPIYLKKLAHMVVQVDGGIWVECGVQALIALTLFAYLTAGRARPFLISIGGCAVVFLAGLPINMSDVAELESGVVAYSGGYNRFAGALLGLLFLMPLRAWVGGLDFGLFLVANIILAMLLLTKISAYQLALVVLVWSFLTGGGRRYLVLTVLLQLVIWLCVSSVYPRYGEVLSYLAGVKAGLVFQQFALRLDFFWSTWGVFVCCYLAAFFLFSLLPAGKIHPDVFLWGLLCLGVTLLFTLTNHGDMGLAPALMALLVPMQLVPARRSGHLVAHLAATCLWLGLIGVWVTRTSCLPVRGPGYMAEWRSLPVVQTSAAPFAYGGPSSSEAQADYMRRAGVAADELRKEIHFHETVYALDFPSYLFSVLGVGRVPRGSLPWLLVGHELTSERHPVAELLFRDVDVLAVPTGSLMQNNVSRLLEIYWPYLSGRYQRVGEAGGWLFYRRAQ